MKIAVQTPILRDGPDLNFLGACTVFAERYADLVFMPHLADTEAGQQARRGDLVMRLGNRQVEVIVDGTSLNGKADVLVGLAAWPYQLENRPPLGFNGLKAYHVMDYVFHAREMHEILTAAGVDFVIGYTFHDEYDPFFAEMYPNFAGRVIAMPFGAAERFFVNTPFSTRELKVIGLGSINPVRDPLADESELADYIEYHSGTTWTHAWRRELLEKAGALSDIFEHRFPDFPDTRNLEYDAVVELTRFAMFANDAGLMGFPPARTYEGAAAGAALVCDGHPSYRDLGFEDGVNCIVHRPMDIEDFRRVVTGYIRDPEALEKVASAGRALARERYSHDAVADELCRDLETLYRGKAGVPAGFPVPVE